MGRNRPTNTHTKNKQFKRSRCLANRSKDLDQIQAEMIKPIPLPLNEDLPGMGQYYCLACGRYFISDAVLKQHYKTNMHKKILKLALEKPYSQEEADAGAGVAPTLK